MSKQASEEENKKLNGVEERLKELSKCELFLDSIFIKDKTARQILVSAYNKLERQQKEIEREKQYADFYKDLCNKQQKLINQLLDDMKERANNFSYESEIMWRKIEKAEKLLEET